MRIPFVRDRNSLIADIVKGMSVLDVGCVDHSIVSQSGGSWLHDDIKKSAARLKGLDCEKHAVESLNSMGYDIEVGFAEMFELNEKFDVVVAGELIEHIDNPAGFLRCAHNHLKDNGCIVLSTPNALCINYTIQNIMRGREGDHPEHLCIYSPTTLSRLLSRHGFHNTKCYFTGEYKIKTTDSLRSRFERLVWQLLQRLCVIFGRSSFCHHFILISQRK
jgi:cyclopropane fatty-acyl-phospholipid synthase-like methyltransferase